MLWSGIFPEAGESKATDQVKIVIEMRRHSGVIPNAFSIYKRSVVRGGSAGGVVKNVPEVD